MVLPKPRHVSYCNHEKLNEISMCRRNQVETAIARSTWQVSGPDGEPMVALPRHAGIDHSLPDGRISCGRDGDVDGARRGM